MESLNIKIYCGNKCNQQCSYCDVIKERDEDFDKIDQFNDFLNRINVPARLTLEGGEPFIYPELIKWAMSLNIPLTILTNGTLMTEDIISQFSKDTVIKISLDGPKFLHNQQRSNYDKVIDTINLLKKYNVTFDIGSTCTKESLVFLERIKEEIDSIKPRIWTLTPQMFIHDANGKSKTKEIYDAANKMIAHWDFPTYNFCLPNFDETNANPETEFLFKNSQIEVHSSGYHTQQQKIYKYDEIKDLINDWF